jgi:hypothetical protein
LPRKVRPKIDYALNNARALLPPRDVMRAVEHAVASAERAAPHIRWAIETTVDPRLRQRLATILRMIEHRRFERAGRWLDQAVEYLEERRAARETIFN